jgi:hypothetical protein
MSVALSGAAPGHGLSGDGAPIGPAETGAASNVAALKKASKAFMGASSFRRWAVEPRAMRLDSVAEERAPILIPSE